MDLDNCIKKRVSTKNYLDKNVPNDVLGLILEAGSLAPSAGNLQNWKFIIVKDPEKKQEISVAAKNQNWMNQASVFIVVCNDKDIITSMYGKRGELYSSQDCAIAAQNIMLKTVDLGLASCWIGSFDEEAVRRILKIPENVNPELILTIGYPAEETQNINREPLKGITFFEEWGKNVDEKTLFPLGQTTEQFIKSISKEEFDKKSLIEKFKSMFKKKVAPEA